MSDSDRIHEPSPVQLLRAKEDGTVIRSSELARSLTFCVVAGTLLVFSATAEQIFGGFLEHTFKSVEIKVSAIDSGAQMTAMIKLLLPIVTCLSAMVLLAIGSWHFQSPLATHFRKTQPDLYRLAPGARLARMLSLDSFLKTIMGLSLLVLLLGIALFFVLFQTENLIASIPNRLRPSLKLAGDFLRNVLIATGTLIILFGLVDYIRERFKINSELRQTDQQQRDEARENEIHPQFRRPMIG
ncbi:MAG: EscU/YscU/HrcU family type III secretion system export apparatus switch protein [Pirellulaceae bacterium]|nr:EscU/YscU/HrcU family type III secretion system export apparatus switch protein [Pirellulaceae bacterium]